jgi:hypothetical protein
MGLEKTESFKALFYALSTGGVSSLRGAGSALSVHDGPGRYPPFAGSSDMMFISLSGMSVNRVDGGVDGKVDRVDERW